MSSLPQSAVSAEAAPSDLQGVLCKGNTSEKEENSVKL